MLCVVFGVIAINGLNLFPLEVERVQGERS